MWNFPHPSEDEASHHALVYVTITDIRWMGPYNDKEPVVIWRILYTSKSWSELCYESVQIDGRSGQLFSLRPGSQKQKNTA
jgi:hypothetical protein